MTEVEKREAAETKKEQKRNRIIGAVSVLVLAIGILIFYFWWCQRPIDRIQEYNVDVIALDDGTLQITYRLKWEVLDSSSEGPLSWVKLGVANDDCELVNYGGDILHPLGLSGSYIKFQLDRSYRSGEVAEFWFVVRQGRMLCTDPNDPNQLIFDFIPGWFTDIPVDHYRFTWQSGEPILSHNADRTWDGALVWEGSLKRDSIRQMRICYGSGQFPGVLRTQWEPFSKQDGSGDGSSRVDFRVVLILLFCGGYIPYQIMGWGEDYRRGRGYHGRHGSRGGGGGCACACAGCACACACAGGGRAGCSNKDFYRQEERPE